MYVYICIYIQSDSGGICETSENDSMCDSKQKSLYKYVSDFRRLRSYGRFLNPYTPSCEPRLQLAGRTQLA